MWGREEVRGLAVNNIEGSWEVGDVGRGGDVKAFLPPNLTSSGQDAL